MVKDWKGWDAVNGLNQSEHTQSGCEKWVWAKPNLYPLMTRKQVVVTILEPIHQSQPCITIHHTYNERLDGSSWYEMAESVCTRSNLVWNVRTQSPNFHHPRLKKQGVVMVVEGEFQSQPFPTIYYTNGQRLEGLRCCELPESVRTYSIWVRKLGLGKAKIVPTHDQKIGCGEDFSAHTPISTMSNHSLYLWREIGLV